MAITGREADYMTYELIARYWNADAFKKLQLTRPLNITESDHYESGTIVQPFVILNRPRRGGRAIETKLQKRNNIWSVTMRGATGQEVKESHRNKAKALSRARGKLPREQRWVNPNKLLRHIERQSDREPAVKILQTDDPRVSLPGPPVNVVHPTFGSSPPRYSDLE